MYLIYKKKYFQITRHLKKTSIYIIKTIIILYKCSVVIDLQFQYAL